MPVGRSMLTFGVSQPRGSSFRAIGCTLSTALEKFYERNYERVSNDEVGRSESSFILLLFFAFLFFGSIEKRKKAASRGCRE